MNCYTKQIVKDVFVLVTSIAVITGCVSSAQHAATNGDAASQTFMMDLKPVANSQKIQLVIRKFPGQRVCVVFKGPGGNLLDRFFTDRHSTIVNQDFNFTDAEQGLYTIEINDGMKTVTRQVELKRVFSESNTTLVVF